MRVGRGTSEAAGGCVVLACVAHVDSATVGKRNHDTTFIATRKGAADCGNSLRAYTRERAFECARARGVCAWCNAHTAYRKQYAAHRDFDFKAVRVAAACAVVDRVKVGERAKERLLLRADADQRGGEEGARVQHCDAVECPSGEMDLHCRQREFLEMSCRVGAGRLTCLRLALFGTATFL